jgi:lysophospholipase L1-like esterase
MPIPVSVNAGSVSTARRKFPDEGSRLVYRSDGGGIPIIGKAGGTVRIYTDPAGTVLADVLYSNSNPATSFIVDKNSLLPDFFGPPDQTDTLYASVDNGTPFKIFSNYDERLDAIFIDNTAKITTQIAAQAVIDSGTYATVIEHGSTAATARPTGAVRVFWRGSVQPTNIIVGDRYINTSTPAAPTESICTGVGPVVLASLGGTASTVGATPSPITGSGGYDPTKSIYNLTPSSFRKIRAKMATAKAGTGLCRIVCAGTSMTAAFKAETRQDTSGYPAQMRSLLVANGYPVGGTGMVQPNTWNVENFDSRITYTTGWNTTGVPTSGAGTLSSSTVASTLTFVGNVAGTKVDVVYANGSGVFTVAIDGTAAVTVTPSGANNGNAIYTVTGLANTTHTVVVTVSTVTTVFILGFQIVGSTGLLVSNAGVDGSTAQAFSDPNFYTWGTVTTSAPWSPDLYILEGPMNDFLQTIALATTTANYVTAANRAKAAGADVILVIDPASTTINGSDAKWDTYRQAMYNAADTIGCPLIDLTESMGRRTTVITNGLDVDGVHLDSAGYAAMGIAIKVALGI